MKRKNIFMLSAIIAVFLSCNMILPCKSSDITIDIAKNNDTETIMTEDFSINSFIETGKNMLETSNSVISEAESELSISQVDSTTKFIEEADVATESEPTSTSKSGSVLNSTSVTLYALDDWEQQWLTIPDDYAQTFTILVNGEPVTTRWWTEDSTIAYADSDGVIHASYSNSYRYDWYTGTMSNTYTYDTPVRLFTTYDDETLEIYVTLKNYGDSYANDILDAYIADNITSDMTTYEKIVNICQFVANYEYNGRYSTMKEMIYSGGGDCWSSVETVNTMCAKLGIETMTRNSALWDTGIGSGHRNSYVNIDGVAYIVDVGYTGSAPRYYSIEEVKDPFVYEKNEDDTVTITHYDGYITENIIIPGTIDGMCVTGIGDSAFEDHSEIKSVYIPEGVLTLGSDVFNNCTSLTEVIIPESVSEIGNGTFYHCDSLSDIMLPPQITYIGDKLFSECSSLVSINIPDGVTSIGILAFSGCKKLTGLELPDGVQSIGRSAFSGCKNITTLHIPNGLLSIDYFAFGGCTGLTNIVLPQTLTSIGERVFEGCSNLTEISVAAGNECFSSEDGILFNVDKTVLLQYPCGKQDVSYVIPDGVIEISSCAFYCNDYLKTLLVPHTVTAVGSYAFGFCTCLDNIGFKGNAPEIGSSAFAGVYANVYYQEDNDTWTSDIMTSYGGRLIWIFDSISSATVSIYSSTSVYSGTAITPTINVRLCGYTLTENTDYKVEYSNNLNAGTATATITGLGGLNGSITKDFTIKPASISQYTVQLSSTVYTYDGTEKRPDVAVSGLSSDDYTVSYFNNTNAGFPHVLVTGTGNYTGTIRESFTINKADQIINAYLEQDSIYVGKQTSVIVSAMGNIYYSSSDRTVATVSSSGVITGWAEGTAEITITATKAKNYKDEETTLTITVKANPVNDPDSNSDPISDSTGNINDTGSTPSTTDGSGNGNTIYLYSSTTHLSNGTISSLTNAANGIKIKWKKVSGASGYYIYRITGWGNYKKIKNINNASITNYTDTKVKNKNGSTYLYLVVPYSGDLIGSGTSESIVRLNKAKLLSVKNPSTQKLTVKWKKSTSVSGYQVQYSTSKSFSKNRTKSKFITSSYKGSQTFSGVRKGKTYYVRVRTYKITGMNKYYSAWSNRKAVNIQK